MWLLFLVINLSLLHQIDADCNDIEFVLRSEWGAVPPNEVYDHYSPGVCGVFIHHTGNGFDCDTKPTCIQKVKQMQTCHMTPGCAADTFSDIAYSWLIGGDGKVYQGRGWLNISAHSGSSQNNAFAYGINLMGNFNSRLPNQKQLDALNHLLFCGQEKGKISRGYKLFGHKDGRCTECPGTQLYSYIQDLPHYSGNTHRITYRCEDTSRNRNLPNPTCMEPAAGSCSELQLVSREEWGATSPAANHEEEPLPLEICGVIIHHTAQYPCSTSDECKKRARIVQTDHIEGSYTDIGYNFLIGEDGKVYEGRGWRKMGAHAPSNNGWTYGISFMGYFNKRTPNQLALNALNHLLACGVIQGYISTQYELFGHRDGRCTNCPGDALYNEITNHPKFSNRSFTYVCPCYPYRENHVPEPTECYGPTHGSPNIIQYPRSTNDTDDTTPHCQAMAGNGTCEFYQKCVQKNVKCRESDGYPLSYGYQFCKKLDEFHDKFDNEGKRWIVDTKKCLMEALAGHIYNSKMTCLKLTHIAFLSHTNCFLKSGVGFCQVFAQSNNLDNFENIFSATALNDRHWLRAAKQVMKTLTGCKRSSAQRLGTAISESDDYHASQEDVTTWKCKLNSLKDSADIFRRDFTHNRKRRSLNEDYDTEELAASGDCKLWEILDSHYPCLKEYGMSITYSVLLPVCIKFKRYESIGPSMNVGRWMKSTQRCLMEHVLPRFNDPHTGCFDIEFDVNSNIVECMVDAGFCSMNRKDEFYLERGLDSKGFPTLDPKEFITYPISGKTKLLDEDYFFGLHWLKDILGDANVVCFQRDQRESPLLYDSRYSPTNGLDMKFRTEL